MISKSRLRKEIKERLNRQDAAQRLCKSNLIEKRLFKLADFKRAEYVMFYLSRSEEVQTGGMIAAARKLGKKIAVPMISERARGLTACLIEDEKTELIPGPYGILQPRDKYIRKIPNERIDLVIVPGIAFDKQGNRLGRGRGYYDRFLTKLSASTPLVGLAFDFQIVKNLPRLSHDIAVTKLISA